MNLYKAAYPFVQGLEFAAVQIIAVDTVEKKRFAHSRLPDKSRSSYPKHRFDRRFEASPESRGSQPSGLLLVLFVEAKRIKPFPFGKVSRFTNLKPAHRKGGFAQSKLKPFPPCGNPWGVEAPPPTEKARCACYGASRFCKP